VVANKWITHAVDEVDEWVVAAVAHREPVACEEDDVDVAIPEADAEPVG
jgi:hypothetical protein